jgi:hypothetical protein
MKTLYLLAFYIKKPREHVLTQQAGWSRNDASYQYDERVEFARNLKKRDVSTAGVILDLRNKSVFKNSFNPAQRDFVTLFKYFLEGYPEQAVRAMADMDPEYLAQFLPAEPVAEETPPATLPV